MGGKDAAAARRIQLLNQRTSQAGASPHLRALAQLVHLQADQRVFVLVSGEGDKAVAFGGGAGEGRGQVGIKEGKSGSGAMQAGRAGRASRRVGGRAGRQARREEASIQPAARESTRG